MILHQHISLVLIRSMQQQLQLVVFDIKTGGWIINNNNNCGVWCSAHPQSNSQHASFIGGELPAEEAGAELPQKHHY